MFIQAGEVGFVFLSRLLARSTAHGPTRLKTPVVRYGTIPSSALSTRTVAFATEYNHTASQVPILISVVAMAEANLVEQIDAYFAQLLSGWNIYSTAIAVLLVTFLIYPLFTSREPDTHPLLLSRQSSVAPVRQPGESAVYRSPETPHGYPLKSGLGVKDPGAPKWSNGRNGDLRDVWRQTVQGLKDKEGNPTGQKGKILTVLGTEQIIDHDLGKLPSQTTTSDNGAAIYMLSWSAPAQLEYC
jgi:hypothetical protein